MIEKTIALVLLAAAFAGCSTPMYEGRTECESADSDTNKNRTLCIDEPTSNPEQSSYADRRSVLLQKIEERKAPRSSGTNAPALTGDDLKKHLEKVQMDAIRKGLPPLPLPLTPEMDAQLVKEGVLSPQ